MALTQLDPLAFEAFGEAEPVVAFVTWLTTQVGGDDLSGWKTASESYRWSGYELDLTLKSRARQREALRDAGADADKWRLACDYVREWAGSTAPYSENELQALRDGCEALGHEPVAQIATLYLRKPATTTKIYSAFHSDRWVIYDSRVGLRLANLVQDWWAQSDGEPGSGLLRFPVPPGRREDAQVPVGFHVLGSDRQARLAFLYASWLCRLIARSLDDHEAPLPALAESWSPQLVEMAFFATAV